MVNVSTYGQAPRRRPEVAHRQTPRPSPLGNGALHYGADMDEHGYPEAEVDGFAIGMFVSYDDCGDAWVRAPDGSIATLIWETGSPPYFREAIAPDPQGRWGTYAVQQPLPLITDEEAADYLRTLLPELRPLWEEWQIQRMP